MAAIILIVFIIVLIAFPYVRCVVFNFPKVLHNGLIDLYRRYKYKEYNICGTGELVAYVGLFGKGKTLSLVHKARTLYRDYNDKLVWDKRRKKFVKQEIHFISNVKLVGIPYTEFTSLKQIIDAANNKIAYEDEHDCSLVTIVLGDEFSVQMNSRSFKTNIDPLFLNTILTCRHYNISLYYTAQRFGHVDALLRQVTSYVFDCNKVWRLQGYKKYDAWSIENAQNPQAVDALGSGCWFVSNKDYNSYDTFACVGNLQKSWEKGDMETSDKILNNIAPQSASVDGVRLSKKFIKMEKKINK